MPELPIRSSKLYYEIVGQGVPLVFLHGLGSSTKDWQAQVERFSAHYQVICVDLRGHGQSGLLRAPYTIQEFSQDVIELIEKLQLGPVHLVGLSLGGIVGLQLALDKKSLLLSLTIINSFVELPFRSFKDKLELMKRLLVIRLLGITKMGGILAHRLFPRDDQADHRQRFLQNWQRNDQKSYLYAFKSLIGWGIRSELHRLTLPILVIGAEFDYTSTEEKKSYVAEMPNATLVTVKNSHHALPVEDPAAFNHALDHFLNSQH